MKRVAVTLTTINVPNLIEDFGKLCQTRDLKEVAFIIVGDLKTPSGTEEFLKKTATKYEIQIEYFDEERQRKTFQNINSLWAHIPFNSFARRNFADLFAYWEGYDVIIRIDDDNFVHDMDFFEQHCMVGEHVTLKSIENSNGWFNVCEVLEEKSGVKFYPRGYPHEYRWDDSVNTVTTTTKAMAVNAGLWLGDPDVDAITRLCRPVEAVSFQKKKFGDRFTLANGTWSPINTQNTAYIRAAIPAAFVSPFAGRYDDILAGYFLRAICDHLDFGVSYGAPLLNQIRNVHNYWHDLDKERNGGESAAELTSLLKNIVLTGNDFSSCYSELLSAVRRDFNQKNEFYHKIFEGMEIWGETFSG